MKLEWLCCTVDNIKLLPAYCPPGVHGLESSLGRSWNNNIRERVTHVPQTTTMYRGCCVRCCWDLLFSRSTRLLVFLMLRKGYKRRGRQPQPRKPNVCAETVLPKVILRARWNTLSRFIHCTVCDHNTQCECNKSALSKCLDSVCQSSLEECGSVKAKL